MLGKMIEYFCVTCNAGPWGQNVRGSDDRLVYQIHVEMGHKVEIFNKDNHETKQGFPGNVRVPVTDEEIRELDEKVKNEREDINRKALEDALDNGRGSWSELGAAEMIVTQLIRIRHEISKTKILKRLHKWAKFYRYDDLDVRTLKTIINEVFAENHETVKEIAFELGRDDKATLFGREQIEEVAYWIMGRYHVKRIDLTGDLLFWDDRVYSTKAEALIRRACRRIFETSLNRDLTEVLRFIEDVCDLISWTHIEESIHLKVLNNGTYNVKTGEFVDSFNPDNIVLNLIPHDFGDVPFDDITNVVSTIISDDNDRESFEDFLSICFHPYNGINFQFGGVGQPGTGKSQLAELANMVCGSDNTRNAAIHQIAEDQTTQKNVGYAMLNIDADLSSETIEHLDVLKKWITQDNFTVRGIYEQSTDFRPTSRLFFMANELPEIPNPDDAEAIYERTHLIKIENKFRGSQSEVKSIMKSTVTPEQLGGFVTFLLRNATQIWKKQKIRHPMPFSTVEGNWNLFGNRIKEFIEKFVVFDPNLRAEYDEPYSMWLSYAMEKGYHNKDRRKFTNIFNELVGSTPTKSRIEGEQTRVYHGFRIKNKREVEEDEKLTIDDTQPKKKRTGWADD